MTLPWYPKDIGKYSRDTKHISMLEDGAYNNLLDHYYANGGLPNVMGHSPSNASSNAQLMPDHSRLYRLCKAMTKDDQDAVDNVLGMFFKLGKDGFYRNAKADKVIEEQTLKHEKRVEAGRKGGLKQCSSNTPQTQTKTKNKSPLPPKGGAAAPRGVFKDLGEGDGADAPMGVFNIEHKLNDDDRAAAKQAAPGWDIHFLMRTYNDSVASGRIDRPRYPGRHFVAWCASYTKGKAP